MGRKGTPFPHLQFMAQSVPPPQIDNANKNHTTTDREPVTKRTVPPRLILHFNHCE